MNRLLELTRRGDPLAAEALWREATRRDDVACLREAIAAASELTFLIDASAESWARARWSLCAAAAARLGLAVEVEHWQRLGSRLDDCNREAGRAGDTRLTRRGVVRAMFLARGARHGVALTHSPRQGSSRSVVALAVCGVDIETVGLGSCAGRWPSPGGVWRALSPWRMEQPGTLARVRRWALEPGDDRIAIPLSEGLEPPVQMMARSLALDDTVARYRARGAHHTAAQVERFEGRESPPDGAL